MFFDKFRSLFVDVIGVLVTLLLSKKYHFEMTIPLAVILNYCKKINSSKHLVRTTVAELHN